MKLTKKNSIVLLLLIGAIQGFSQQDTLFWNSKMKVIADIQSTKGWVKIKPEIQIPANSFFEIYNEAFNLPKHCSMEFVRSDSDELGYTHYRYQLYYSGIKVEGAEYILHELHGAVVSANGKLPDNLDIDIIPSISKEIANQVVMVELAKDNMILKTNKKSIEKTELVITRVQNNKDFSNSNYRLSYKSLVEDSLNGNMDVYIDAKESRVLKSLPNSKYCFTGTGNYLYNNQPSITFNTVWQGIPFLLFYLKDNCRGDGIYTYNNMATFVETDIDNNWSSNSQRPFISAHWAVEKSWDYFLNIYGQYGPDNDGKGVDVHLVTSPTRADAYSDRNKNDKLYFFWGDNGITDYQHVSLDIVGHEYTHLVGSRYCDFKYEKESGALCESFSDIFGEMIEYNTLNNCDWIHANDVYIVDNYKRSLCNPKSKINFFADGSPDTYEGDYWQPINCGVPSISNDYCGIHVNCAPQNYWFYLLSEGSNGNKVNDKQFIYNVQGIGKNAASLITFRNLIYYLTTESDYADSKNGSILSAIDLYGSCSNEVIQTVNAWNAVGVESNGDILGDVVTTNCSRLNQFHEIANLEFTGINSITSDCNISTTNNYQVVFQTLGTIYLNNGFRAGNGFIARNIECFGENQLKSNFIENETNLESNEFDFLKNLDSLSQLTTNSIYNITPNPNKGEFNVVILGDIDKLENLIIQDLQGKILYNEKIKTNNEHVFLPYLKGVYIITLKYDNKAFSKKIIIK